MWPPVPAMRPTGPATRLPVGLGAPTLPHHALDAARNSATRRLHDNVGAHLEARDTVRQSAEPVTMMMPTSSLAQEAGVNHPRGRLTSATRRQAFLNGFAHYRAPSAAQPRVCVPGTPRAFAQTSS
jgi:hypothetical protein